jgi:hypothetical protein
LDRTVSMMAQESPVCAGRMVTSRPFFAVNFRSVAMAASFTFLLA